MLLVLCLGALLCRLTWPPRAAHVGRLLLRQEGTAGRAQQRSHYYSHLWRTFWHGVFLPKTYFMQKTGVQNVLREDDSGRTASQFFSDQTWVRMELCHFLCDPEKSPVTSKPLAFSACHYRLTWRCKVTYVKACNNASCYQITSYL